MVLKNTVHTMKELIETVACDLNKADRGNKSAAQRVRTRSVEFAKLSKIYRKESVAAEKKRMK